MLADFKLSEVQITSLKDFIKGCEQFAEDKSEFGYGFRKQLLDEFYDAAGHKHNVCFCSDLETAFPDMANALIPRISPKSVITYSNAMFYGDDRITSKIELQGREKATEVFSAFWKIARFIRSKRFWKLHSERNKTFELLDDTLKLLASTGYQYERQKRLVEKNAH